MADTIADGNYYIINGRSISTAANAGDVSVWRAYNSRTKDHFFTTDITEYQNACWHGGYSSEGLAFMLTSGDKTTPIYRCLNKNSGEHLYTASDSEYATWKKIGLTDEGIAFYGGAKSNGSAPVYRLYNSSIGRHIYTTNPGEKNSLANSGWTLEGIAFYAAGVYALDVEGNVNKDYTNVHLWPYGQTDAQIWRITTRSDGSRRILNRSNGRSLDVEGGYWSNGNHKGTYNNGQNVIIYHDDGLQNQRWKIEPSTVTQDFQGTTYTEYWIRLWNDPDDKTWELEVSGADLDDALYPGKNVDISYGTWSGGDTTHAWNDRTWIFIPVPNFRPNQGIYSIRPLSDTTKYLDCNGTTTNGANCYLYSRYSGSNTQFWIFKKSTNSSKYKLRNLGSGRMLDVNNARFANGTNVQVWNENDTVAQQWGVTTYGTEPVNGTPRQVVRLDVGSLPYCLDYDSNKVGNNTNVQIYQNNDTAAQRWVLVPETMVDPTVPVPQNLYLNSAVGKLESGDRAYQDRLYPSWTCTDAWFYGTNHYEFRWRKRYCNSNSSKWENWSNWTDWVSVGTTASKNNYWLTDGIDTSYEISDYKNMEIEFGVRCIGTPEDYTSSVRGGSATATHKNIFVPTFTFPQAGFNFDGLRIGYESDYGVGQCYLYLMGLEYAPSTNGPWTKVINEEIKYEGLDVNWVTIVDSSDGTFTGYASVSSISIPIGKMIASVPVESYLRLTYQKGNDQNKRWTWKTWQNIVRVSSNAGTVDVDFKVENYYRHTGLISVPKQDTANVWIVTNNKVSQLVRITDPGHGFTVDSSRAYFLYPYTWYSNALVSASIASSNGTQWGMNTATVTRDNLDLTPVHVWITEDGDIVCLDCREGDKLESNRNLEATSNTVTLNNREHELVTFGKTVKNSFSAEGAIMYSDEFGYTDCTVEEVESLISKHCLYRDPYGRLLNVAVTGVSSTAHHDHATVTVDMIEETR